MSNIASQPLVGILMGSKSDWETMQACSKLLSDFGVPNEAKVASAHRSPELVTEYVTTAEKRGIEILIAAAGLAAHLPGVVAAQTLLPVLGVPMQSPAVGGLDAILSIVQMPGGVPVGALAVGSHGAKNAALLAIRILALARPELREKLVAYHKKMADQIASETLN
ncbi:MAG TPA: 5-(carboxyamino)imidazole ribonucleotide mutase [Lacipirellulaceae bacterium]|jgi:5-(carboxyamino)imidazole ribonucleotide mutase|nr:5-(carboxyamino)imidazole ribonucleotide mutase [Lacipirellulaceae bacterium]